MSKLYLSQVRLKDDPRIWALAPALTGSIGDALRAGHHLIWSLFTNPRNHNPDQERDFLWREASKGQYIILSSRRPPSDHMLLEVMQCKVFEPQIKQGDRLSFELRANAVTRAHAYTRPDGRTVNKKHDVVTHYYHNAQHARDARPGSLREAADRQGLIWLKRQGARAGFGVYPGLVRTSRLTKYQVPHPKSGEPMRFSALDFQGVIEVKDPETYLEALPVGFGAMKAFGCGLMLIRPSYV